MLLRDVCQNGSADIILGVDRTQEAKRQYARRDMESMRAWKNPHRHTWPLLCVGEEQDASHCWGLGWGQINVTLQSMILQSTLHVSCFEVWQTIPLSLDAGCMHRASRGLKWQQRIASALWVDGESECFGVDCGLTA